MKIFSKKRFRDVLLSVDWALTAFFLVKLTPFELGAGDFLKNIGGVALFALFVIAFELLGKELIWEIAGKHHRLGKQIIALFIILLGLAGLFTMVA